MKPELQAATTTTARSDMDRRDNVMSDALTPTADLIRRLEEADEGSRELSDEVLVWVGWHKDGEYFWKNRGGTLVNPNDRLDPTRRLDDIPKAMPWANIDHAAKHHGAGRWVARQAMAKECAYAPTEALARCIAVMKGDPR